MSVHVDVVVLKAHNGPNITPPEPETIQLTVGDTKPILMVITDTYKFITLYERRKINKGE